MCVCVCVCVCECVWVCGECWCAMYAPCVSGCLRVCVCVFVELCGECVSICLVCVCECVCACAACVVRERNAGEGVVLWGECWCAQRLVVCVCAACRVWVLYAPSKRCMLRKGRNARNVRTALSKINTS